MSGASDKVLLAPSLGPSDGPEPAEARDPLRYTFDDARQQQLLDGMAMTTEEKIAWFEEMVVAWAACLPVAATAAGGRAESMSPDLRRASDT